MESTEITDILPVETAGLHAPPHLNSDLKVEKTFVEPIFRLGEKPIRQVVAELYPPETINSMQKQVTPEVVRTTLENGLGYNSRTEAGSLITSESLPQLIRQDLVERLNDHAILSIFARSKRELANMVRDIISAEKQRNSFEKKSETDQAILDLMEHDLGKSSQAMEKLANESLTVEPNPVEDAFRAEKLKREIMYHTNILAGLSQATERVSPEIGRVSQFHRGPIQASISENVGFLTTRGSGVYAREQAGSMAHILGLNLAREHSLPADSNTARREVETYTSGMGAMGSILEAVENEESEILVTQGTYFELPETAKKHLSIQETIPCEDQLYFQIADKLKIDTEKPLVLFAQPFASGLEKEVFDLKRVLKIAKEADGQRPFVLIIDSTMHGASLNNWSMVKEITDLGKDFTYIEIQSLVKYGQIGMDATPGGVAFAYGSRPEIIRTSTGSRGTMMSEHAAAVILPFSAEAQLTRIQRAGRNAEYIATRLRAKLRGSPIFENVHYNPHDDPETAKQYTTKSPILFIEINPIIPETAVRSLFGNFYGIHRIFPESGVGTSYGFDGTRFEMMHLGRDRAATIRIAAGQESTIPLIKITHFIEKTLASSEFIRNSSSGLRNQIGSIVNPYYTQETIQTEVGLLTYDPDFNPTNDTDQYLSSLATSELMAYFKNQCDGHAIKTELGLNGKLKEMLAIENTLLEQLSAKLETPEKIQWQITEWVITRPDFLKKFQERLKLLGKLPSMARTYQIAKALNSNKGVKVVLAPLAKIAAKVLQEMQPIIESQIGAKLPFTY